MYYHTWYTGMKLRSSFLCDKHLTNGAISLAKEYPSYPMTSATALIIMAVQNLDLPSDHVHSERKGRHAQANMVLEAPAELHIG